MDIIKNTESKYIQSMRALLTKRQKVRYIKTIPMFRRDELWDFLVINKYEFSINDFGVFTIDRGVEYTNHTREREFMLMKSERRSYKRKKSDIKRLKQYE